MIRQLEEYCWEIRDVAVYQIINQGQATELIGIIDGESSEFNQIEKGFLTKDIINRWQESIVVDIKNNRIDDEKSFTSHHMKLLRSTGHELIADFEEQKPELCM